MDERKLIYAEGEELAAHLEDLLEKAKAGKPVSCVIRIFNNDGTWKDIALADTEEEKARLLAEFRDFHKRNTQ